MVYYIEFGDYCRIAAEVLGLEPEQIAKLPNIGLADSEGSPLAKPGRVR